MKTYRLPAVTAALTGMLALAACSGGSQNVAADPTDEATPTQAVVSNEPCVEGTEKFVTVMAPDDAKLTGIALGSGTTGVAVLASGLEDACDWLPYGREWAKSGKQVVILNVRQTGTPRSGGFSEMGTDATAYTNTDRDAAAAAQYLIDQGVEEYVFVGVQDAGLGQYVAASTLQPAPSGVLLLSARHSNTTLNGHKLERPVRVPVVFLHGASDVRAVEAARTLMEVTASKQKLAQSYPTSAVGIELFTDENSGEQVNVVLNAFLEHTLGA